MQLRGKAVVIRRDGGAFVDKVLRASEAGTWLLGTDRTQATKGAACISSGAESRAVGGARA